MRQRHNMIGTVQRLRDYIQTSDEYGTNNCFSQVIEQIQWIPDFTSNSLNNLYLLYKVRCCAQLLPFSTAVRPPTPPYFSDCTKSTEYRTYINDFDL